jgi:hypothetical protein
LLLSGTSGQDVSVVLGQTREDSGHLLGRFTFSEYHFRHTVAQGTVMIDLGKAQVLEGKMPDALHRLIGRKLALADLLE